MVALKDLQDGHGRFYQKYYVENPDLYQSLVKGGQSPKTLVISCSDSRADPAIFFDTKPGDLFVIRNVANLVPPYQADKATYHGTSAALEFGVKILKIENIVVIGHTYCAGIQTLLEVSEHKNTTEYIEDWVHIAAHAKTIAQNLPHSFTCCLRESIRISLENLLTFPWIAERVKEGNLNILGWYFDMDTGKLEPI